LSDAPREHGLGFAELCVIQARAGDAHSGLFLRGLDFEELAFRRGLFTRREVFPDTFFVEPTVDAIDDFAGGVRKFLNDELLLLFHDRFCRSTGQIRHREN
jgi:hypothetical protein